MIPETMTAAFTPAYFANIAGLLTGHLLSGAGRAIQRKISGTDAEAALRRCVQVGVIAVVQRSDTQESDHLAGLLEVFFTEPETGGELSEILNSRAPDYKELRRLFEAAGYDPETLPDIRFEDAMAAFEPAFLAAAVQEPSLQPIIQTTQLLEQTRIQGELLAAMQALVAFFRSSKPETIGIQAGTIIAENVVSGELHSYQPGVQPPAMDDRWSEASYLKQLIFQCDHLDLSAVDDTCPSEGRDVRLSDVFTALYLKGIERLPDQPVADVIRGRDRPEERMHLKVQQTENNERMPVQAVDAAGAVNRLVILGRPGGGKSTLVNHITAQLALRCLGKQDPSTPLPGWPDTESPLPVRVILRRFAAWMPDDGKKGTPKLVWDYLAHMMGEWGCPEFSTPLKRMLNKTGGVIFFDGLDEVREADADQKRTRIVEAIQAFAAPLDKCKVVVTCREYAYTKDDAWRLPEAMFPVVELDLFGEPQIRAFTRTYYRATGKWKGWDPARCDSEAENLAGAIDTLPHLKELAQYPLLLTLMAQVHGRDGFLPQNRADLYERAVTLLLAHWENRIECDAKGSRRVEPGLVVRLGVPLDTLRSALERVALAAHEQQETAGEDSRDCADISREDLRQELAVGLENDWNRAETAIAYIQRRAGLIQARDAKTFAFPHRTFQEYLTATGIMRKGNFEEVLRSCLLRDPEWWWEVFLLAAGSSRNTPKNIYDLMDALLPDEPGVGIMMPQNVLLCRLCAQAIHESDFLRHVVEESRISGPGRYDKIHRRVQVWLMNAMAADDRLTPKDRVAAGNALNWVGDPRFDPDFYYLPKDKNLGFIKIPAGEFRMGTRAEDVEENQKLMSSYAKAWVAIEIPRHPVRLSSYWMSQFPVTVAQYRSFAQEKEKQLDAKWRRDNRFDNHPVVDVSWDDALAYCEWLREKLKDRGWRIALPTEAQWEKAARDASDRVYPWEGDFDKNRLNCEETGIGTTSPVGCFPGGESPYGMLDMAGNVWEWCADRFGEEYYASSPSDDPIGPAKGSSRVFRGGAWYGPAMGCRAAYRYWGTPDNRHDFLGFRLSRS